MKLFSLATLLTLAGAIVLSLLYGAGNDAPGSALAELVVQSRLPRTLAAMIVGGGLALSGTLLQCITRNPLAEPGLLGVNAGGVLGLTIGLTYFSAASISSYMMWSGGGALAAIVLVLCVGGLARRTSPPHLILIGIAASATLGGIANAILMANAAALEQFRFWNLGSLAGARMASVTGAFPYFLAGCAVILFMTRWLSAMQLGEDQARALGVPTAAVTLAVWITTAVLTACALSIAGPVMFAGFLAAYLARFAAGPRFGLQVVLSFLFGMILLLAGDVCARWVIRPYEVPVGVVVALLGTPLTIFVARTRAFRTSMLSE